MGVQLVSTPAKWDSASRPMESVFASNLSPASLPGDANLPIFEIRQPNLFELTNAPALDDYDVIVTGDWSLSNFVVGDYVTITGTIGAQYLGTFRVRKSINVNIIVIETQYTIDDTGGLLSRVYRNYVLRSQVIASNDGFNPKTYTLLPNSSGLFVLNPSDYLSRTFPSIFTEVFPGTGFAGIGTFLRSVVQAYGATIGEAYDIPVNGIPEFFDPGPAFKLISNRFVVNSQHPYHEVNVDGTEVLRYTDTYDNYIVNNATTGSARFLTYGPSDGQQECAEGEDFFLAYLWDGNRNDGLELTVSRYTAAGTFIANSDVPMAPPETPGAYVLNVGLSQLIGLVEDSAATYRVALQNGGEQLITEPFTITVRRDCSPSDRRMFWRNGLGGIDQYTFTAREDENIDVSTRTITKPYMDRNFRYVEWSERAYRTDVMRSYNAWGVPKLWAFNRWLARSLAESADIVTNILTDVWTKVILEDATVPSYSSKGGAQRMSVTYRLGVDNRKQQQ
jgi:hypothetical protein